MSQDPSNNPNQGANDPSPPSSSLEEVRKQLQSYGYLNSRIERFYLHSLSATASQLLSRLLLSFRVGLLAGTLSAILMTSGSVLMNPELMKKKLDIILLFLYLEVFFVLLFTVLEMILIFVVSGLTRFFGGKFLFMAGQGISFLVGLAFFGYFFYWGMNQFEYIRIFSSFSQAILFLILIMSCIFVSKCSWLGFLVAFRASEIGKALPDWRRHSIEVLLSVAAVLMLLPVILGSQKENEKGPPLAVRTTPDQWIVIGIDGLTLNTVNKFAAKGEIPGIRSLMEESFVARLRPSETTIPPVAWTNIATGVPPAQHGIVMPEVRRWRGLSSWMQITPFELAVHSVLFHAGFGQRQPVSGYLRKVKTFWEIFSDAGIRAGVVNWWGSWPALPMRGWNISERYYYKLLSGQPPQDETFPKGLFSLYSVQKPGAQIKGPELDSFYAQLFLKQLETDRVRVAAVYLPGFDILNYEFFEGRKQDPFSYTESYSNHLHQVDRFISEINLKYPAHHIILILYPGRSLPSDQGGILVSGYGTSMTSRTFPETELVPLMLYTCGLPVAKSMQTDLLRSLVSSEQFAKLPIQSVPSFPAEATRIPSAHADAFDDVLVEQLKSLGYLQ